MKSTFAMLTLMAALAGTNAHADLRTCIEWLAAKATQRAEVPTLLYTESQITKLSDREFQRLQKLFNADQKPPQTIAAHRKQMTRPSEGHPYGWIGNLVRAGIFNARNVTIETRDGNADILGERVVHRIDQVMISSTALLSAAPALKMPFAAMWTSMQHHVEFGLWVNILRDSQGQRYLAISPTYDDGQRYRLSGEFLESTSKYLGHDLLAHFGREGMRDLSREEVWFVHTHPDSNSSFSIPDVHDGLDVMKDWFPGVKMRIFALVQERGFVFEKGT